MRRRICPLLLLAAVLLALWGCGASPQEERGEPEAQEAEVLEPAAEQAPVWGELAVTDSLELSYATQFAVDYYEGDYALVSIGTDQRFLVVPEAAPVPAELEADITVLQQPLDQIYLVSSAAMDYFRELDSIGNVTLSGTKASDWYIEEAKAALESGEMTYAGKYSAPDYELILSQGCDLAVENTMIYHSPEVKEELEDLGIPVLVERSSYESDPLGRMEWLKLYAVLLDKEEQAEEFFLELEEALEAVLREERTGKTVAFFYITSSGAVNVRKSWDYMAKAIDMAGGDYIAFLDQEEDNALSTVTIQMETFYALARDADYLIYNSSIAGELYTTEELVAQSELLADFDAVQEGRVWCTGKNLYQEPLSIGELIVEIRSILTTGTVEDEASSFLHRLE